MTVSIINIAPTEAIKPRLLVDFRGILIDDADTKFSLRRTSDNQFWNFVDQEWNLPTESASALKTMTPVGSGEYDAAEMLLTDLGVSVGELLAAKFRATKDLISDVAIDYYKVKVAGVPTMKFPQTRDEYA